MIGIVHYKFIINIIYKIRPNLFNINQVLIYLKENSDTVEVIAREIDAAYQVIRAKNRS